ncbi:Choline dehydrogenase [Mycena kentingensis (nom. inval.)]|nr:Choline dehydrogenase [Mycena kentingensis (nom. inval.)]
MKLHRQLASTALLLGRIAAAALEPCSTPATDAADVFDFVVVGSGAGGGPLAARLAEAGFSVFLVDAGSDVYGYNSTLPAYWARATEDPATVLGYNVTEYSAPNSRVAWYPRAGALGGSTIHNAMINIIAGTRRDFDKLVSITGDSSWSRDNMQSYYKKIERNEEPLATLLTSGEHGYKGWLATTLLPYFNLLHKLAGLDAQLLSIFAALQLSALPIWDLNTRASDGATGLAASSFTIDRTHIRSSVYNRLKDVEPRTALNITLNTLVTKVLMCKGLDGSPTAYGVEIAPNASLPVADKFRSKQPLVTSRVLARHEVILSAGVFQSPQLLMLSGIGDRQQLTKFGIETVVHLPGVGSNLQDHDEVAIAWKLKNDFKLLKGCKFLSDPAADPCLSDWIASNHRSAYSFNPVLNTLLAKTDNGETLTYIAPAYFEGIVHGMGQKVADNTNGFTGVVLLAHPSSRGYVRLTGNHPQDTLDIAKRHFEDPNGDGARDVAALVAGLERMQRLVYGSLLIRPWVKEQAFPAGRDANLTQHVLDAVFGHHACCTNAMGPADDPNAVLDGQFRVRGTRGLRVVDMSSWSEVPGYFVTTPMYMMSEKAVESIARDALGRGA